MVPLEMTMSMTQLIGPELIRLAESFDHVASFGFMVEDTSRGSVREVMGQPVIQYWLSDKDVAHIKRGVDVLAQVFFAAGAHARAHADRRLRRARLARRSRSAAPRDDPRRGTSTSRRITRSAPRAWAPIRRRSVVGADHQMHDTPGLYVVDGAAVPTRARREPADHDHGARDARRRANRDDIVVILDPGPRPSGRAPAGGRK